MKTTGRLVSMKQSAEKERGICQKSVRDWEWVERKEEKMSGLQRDRETKKDRHTDRLKDRDTEKETKK